MGEVIYLDPANAIAMNDLKKVISWAEKNNSEGKFNRSIEFNKSVFRSFMDSVLGRPKESSEEELAA